MDNLKDFLISIFYTFCILYTLFCFIGCSESNNTQQPQSITVEFSDSSYNLEIIIIKDNRRNLQWDAFKLDRALVILPGTEKPIK